MTGETNKSTRGNGVLRARTRVYAYARVNKPSVFIVLLSLSLHETRQHVKTRQLYMLFMYSTSSHGHTPAPIRALKEENTW